jgi:membrane-bound serine protease (ClpP class)
MKPTYYPLIFFFFLLFFLLSSASAQTSSVLLVDITGTIDHSTVEIIHESFAEAKSMDAAAVILLLDTPGGGLQETFDIADMIKDNEIPVVGYVYPGGSAAWSAGTFILLSTHVAAMADHTIIGSAQPVEITIEGTKTITDSKTINALVEWIQERAAMYGRNTTTAGEFITQNLNLNETEALARGVIEYTASDITELLSKIDGTIVQTSSGTVTLNTFDAQQITYTPSLKIQLMKFLSNPLLTSLLFMIGIFALIFGISSPGYGAEVFGVIAILVSLIGSGFSIPALSIIFIFIGCLLLVIEIFVTPGFGVIGIGGFLCLFIGSLFLIPTYTTREWMISMGFITEAFVLLAVFVVILAVFFGFLLYKVLQIRKKKTAIGTFIGEKAKTIDEITPEKTGYIRFNGELWQAKSKTPIGRDVKVIIIDKDEEILIIEPANQ